MDMHRIVERGRMTRIMGCNSLDDPVWSYKILYCLFVFFVNLKKHYKWKENKMCMHLEKKILIRILPLIKFSIELSFSTIFSYK